MTNLPCYGQSEINRVVEVFNPKSGWNKPQSGLAGNVSFDLNAASLGGATHVQLEITHNRIGIPQTVCADFAMSELGL